MTSQAPKRTLNVIQFGVMCFIITCAGPYGIEVVVNSGGILLTFLGLMIIPFIYCLPQSLMVAELSSMMPTNHGYIVWVYRAFGDRIGFVNAINCIVGNALDLPLYPVSLVQTFSTLYPNSFGELSPFIKYLIKLSVVLFGCVMCILNIKNTGNSSIIACVLIMIPLIFGFLYSLPQTNVNTWVKGPPQGEDSYDYGLFFTSLLWLQTGWDMMGSIAGEVNFELSSFFKGFSIGIILDFLCYTITLLAVLTQYDSNDKEKWKLGYVIKSYDNILHGLKYPLIVGTCLGIVMLYVVELSSQVRSIWSIAQPNIIFNKHGKIIFGDLIQLYDNEEKSRDESSRSYGMEKDENQEIELIPYTSKPKRFKEKLKNIKLNIKTNKKKIKNKDINNKLLLSNDNEDIKDNNNNNKTVNDSLSDNSETDNVLKDTNYDDIDNVWNEFQNTKIKTNKNSISENESESSDNINNDINNSENSLDNDLNDKDSSDDNYLVPSNDNLNSNNNRNNNFNFRIIEVGIIPNRLGYIWSKTSSPVFAVIAQSIFTSIFCIFEYGFLIELSMFIFGITWLCESAAFIKLRYSQPNVNRPFKVPGGMKVAWLVVALKYMVVFIIFIGVGISKPYIIVGSFGWFLLVIIWLYLRQKYKTKILNCWSTFIRNCIHHFRFCV